jgi:hypothetical protein
MTDDELAAIRERDSELAEFAPRMDAVYADRRALLAEVVRLRAQLAEALADCGDEYAGSAGEQWNRTTAAVPRASVEAARVAVQRDQDRGRDSDPATIRLANATTQTGNKT